MTERLENAVNQIKQYQLCYYCDYYDEDNMHCTAEDVNCVETISNQIRNEILDEVIKEIKTHSEDDKLMNKLYIEWINNMKQ